MLSYVVTIFAGAFMHFQVQSLNAKYILPWFGGSPTVWSTCMVYFQAPLRVLVVSVPPADGIYEWVLRCYLG